MKCKSCNYQLDPVIENGEYWFACGNEACDKYNVVVTGEKELNDLCPACGTELLNAPGIGLYCPNEECDVADNINGYKEDKEDEAINPNHYKLFLAEECENGIETIDIIRKSLTPEEFRGFLKGNMLKYLTRALNKNGTEDERKASWYGEMLGGSDPRPKR